MELLYTPNSPYSRIARVRILEQALDVRFTPVSVREAASELLAYNPAGKVPTLLLDDGRALSDGRLICEYLDSINPSDFFARPDNLDGRCIEGVAAGFLDGVAVWIREVRREKAEQSPGVLKLEAERFDRCLGCFERKDLSSSRLDYACTTIASAVELVDMRISEAWRGRYPRMHDWFERISEHASLRATAPLK